MIMTRFEELKGIIERNKPGKKSLPNEQGLDIEVPGLTEGSGSGKPSINFATDEQDPDLVDQLYTKPKHKPNDGSEASY